MFYFFKTKKKFEAVRIQCHIALLVHQLKNLVLDYVLQCVKHCLLFLVEKYLAAQKMACESP